MIFGKRSRDDDAPLTTNDFARTTTDSPESTALIPTVKPPAPAAAPRPRGPMVVRLKRIDPFSVTRLTFVVSVCLMIVMTVAVAACWLMLAAAGVWDEINASVASVLSQDSAAFDITDYVGFTRMVGGTLVLSGINVVLMTALATVGAHLYNRAAALLGGVEATLVED